MVKKLQKISAEKKSGAQLSGTIKDSASQIWLAGLGAFAKAQEEGGKVFEALVKEGMSIQRKTQAAAEEKLSEATTRMATMATDLSSKASGQWDKLETIFEERAIREFCDGVVIREPVDLRGALLQKDFELFFVTSILLEHVAMVERSFN